MVWRHAWVREALPFHLEDHSHAYRTISVLSQTDPSSPNAATSEPGRGWANYGKARAECCI